MSSVQILQTLMISEKKIAGIYILYVSFTILDVLIHNLKMLSRLHSLVIPKKTIHNV